MKSLLEDRRLPLATRVFPRPTVAAPVPGATAALLGNLEARREFGKVGTQSDIHLHEFKEGDTQAITIVPAQYPGSVKPLSYAVLNCDSAALVVDKLTPQVGEQILAADAAGIRHGIVILQNYLQPEQLKPILKGTALESWPVQTEPDWAAARQHLVAAPPRGAKEKPVVVPIDHHFNVKGVGAVVLAVVKQGTLKKGETLYAYPDKVICPVRSIQIHDVDHSEALPGDRVGLALRNTPPEMLDRGMVLAPADAPVKVHAAGSQISFRLKRAAFSKQPLKAGSVVQVGAGMQYVPLRLSADAPSAGQEGAVAGTLEKGLVHLPGERAVLWHQDNVPQRVVGALTLD
jgi:selenocysteine-specific translation elongation factor